MTEREPRERLAALLETSWRLHCRTPESDGWLPDADWLLAHGVTLADAGSLTSPVPTGLRGEPEPTDAEEPPWPNWFSCEECHGWFYAPRSEDRVIYESGSQVCAACAEPALTVERLAEALMPEVHLPYPGMWDPIPLTRHQRVASVAARVLARLGEGGR